LLAPSEAVDRASFCVCVWLCAVTRLRRRRLEAAATRARAAWLSQGGTARLLRSAGWAANPLDAATPWHLLTSLQVSYVGGAACGLPCGLRVLGRVQCPA
jgi:hypothetical protein